MCKFPINFTDLLFPLLLVGCTIETNEKGTSTTRQADSLMITNAWVRPAAEGANSAAYMIIHNHTSRADTLTGVTSDAAAMAAFHESYEKEGMMGMRPARFLILDSGRRLELKPGEFHVMLMQMQRQLISGDSLRLNLQFARAGTKEITAVVH